MRKLTPHLVAKIHTRKRAGLSQEQIAAQLKISQGSVSNALREKAPRVAGKTKGSAKSSPRIGRARPPATRDELRETLAGVVATITDLAERAKREKDSGVYLQLARVSSGLIKELGRLMPAEPPNHDESPDMVEAARRAREKILERIRRSAKSSATAPKCTACGHPLRERAP